jgi:hypothetical protein
MTQPISEAGGSSKYVLGWAPLAGVLSNECTRETNWRVFAERLLPQTVMRVMAFKQLA